MLREALPHAVAPCPAGETRHDFQVKIIDCVRRALADAHAAAEVQAAASREASEAARAQEAEAKVVAERAQEVASAAGAEVKAKAEALAIAETKVREEQTWKKSIELEAQRVLEAHTERETRKAEIEALVAFFDGAAALSVEAAESIATFLTAKRAEKTLVAAVPAALALVPDARSQFDNLVVDSAKTALHDALVEAQAALDAGAEAAKYAEAESLGAWAVLDCARDRATAADATLSAAKAALVDAQSVQEAKVAAVAAATERLQVALVEQTLAEDKPSGITKAQQALERLVQGEAVVDQASAAQTVSTPPAGKANVDPSFAPVPMDLDTAATAGA